MKNNQMNGYLRTGILIFAITLIAKQFIRLPEFISGFGLGIAIALELIGLYSMNHDMSKMKNFKKSLFRKLVKR